jgi:hypothetical protein
MYALAELDVQQLQTILEAASAAIALRSGTLTRAKALIKSGGSQGIAAREWAPSAANGQLYVTSVRDVQTRLLVRGLCRIVYSLYSTCLLLLVLPNIMWAFRLASLCCDGVVAGDCA